jgi:hypothetical protein
MWFIYTMEYYSAIKNGDILSFAGKWMELGWFCLFVCLFVCLFIGYFLYLHFKCYPLLPPPPHKDPISHPSFPWIYEGVSPPTDPPIPTSLSSVPLHWGIYWAFIGPSTPSSRWCMIRLSLQCMKLGPCVLLCWRHSPWELFGGLVGWYCCSFSRVAIPFNSFGPFSNSSIRDPMLSPIAGFEHPSL